MQLTSATPRVKQVERESRIAARNTRVRDTSLRLRVTQYMFSVRIKCKFTAKLHRDMAKAVTPYDTTRPPGSEVALVCRLTIAILNAFFRCVRGDADANGVAGDCVVTDADAAHSRRRRRRVVSGDG